MGFFCKKWGAMGFEPGTYPIWGVRKKVRSHDRVKNRKKPLTGTPWTSPPTRRPIPCVNPCIFFSCHAKSRLLPNQALQLIGFPSFSSCSLSKSCIQFNCGNMAPHGSLLYLASGFRVRYKLSTEQRYLSCTLSSERHRLSGNSSCARNAGMKMTAFHVVKDLQRFDFHVR